MVKTIGQAHQMGVGDSPSVQLNAIDQTGSL